MLSFSGTPNVLRRVQGVLRDIWREVMDKVYCKECKYFPRFNIFGTHLAECKAYKRNMGFYGRDIEVTAGAKWKFCVNQNSDNNCRVFKER